MKNRVGRWWLVVSMLLSGVVIAAEPPFEKGVAAFKNNDYQVAIDWFEQAKQAGDQSAILAYNLAVSHYKLGQYEKAKLNFVESAKNASLAGLSYYNIGLIALKEDDEGAARTAFHQSLEAAEDENLKLLAAQRLDGLVKADMKSDASDINGFISLSAGYDDNVTRVNEVVPTIANKSDSYLDLFGTLGYQISGNRNDGLQFKGGVLRTRYSNLSAYNQTLLNAGLYLAKPLAEWLGSAGLVYYNDSFNGSGFQQRLALQLRADKHYRAGQRLRLKFDLTNYDALDAAYAYLSGSRQRFTVENRSRFGAQVLYLGYRLELNNRNDVVALNTFSSYSPTRNTLYASYGYTFSPKWSSRADYDYRRSNYGSANVVAGVNQGVRDEARSRYGLAAIYRYNRDTEFETSWRYTSNNSNYNIESYNSSVLMLSANRYF